MSIPTRLKVTHPDGTKTVERCFTLSYGTDVDSREAAQAILIRQFSHDDIPSDPRYDWIRTFVAIEFYGYEFSRAEIIN